MIKLTFLGDLMCDYSIASRFEKYIDQNGSYNFRSIFSHLKPLLDESDYVIANLETPISIDDLNLTYKQNDFYSPIEFAQAIKESGINLVSTANNHCLDRGLEGLRSTINSLEAIGLDYSGTQKESGKRYFVFCCGMLRIGFLAYTYGTNAFANYNYLPLKKFKEVNLLQEQEGRVKQIYRKIFRGRFLGLLNCLEKHLYPNNETMQPFEKETISFFRRILIRNDLKKLKREKTNLNIAYLHIGGQLNIKPSEYTIQQTNWLLKRGINIVIDNHEHVIHGSYIKNGQIAAYALGDCLSGVGLLYPPFDRYADYSIAFHVYVDERTKKIKHCSFSVLKRRLDSNKKIEIWQAYDLLKKHPDELAEKDILHVARLFSGNEYTNILKEFSLIIE